jgi:hypothetical protein
VSEKKTLGGSYEVGYGSLPRTLSSSRASLEIPGAVLRKLKTSIQY